MPIKYYFLAIVFLTLREDDTDELIMLLLLNRHQHKHRCAFLTSVFHAIIKMWWGMGASINIGIDTRYLRPWRAQTPTKISRTLVSVTGRQMFFYRFNAVHAAGVKQ